VQSLGPFPRSYKSVTQPAVMAFVMHIVYKSAVHLPGMAGSPTHLKKTRRAKRLLYMREYRSREDAAGSAFVTHL
jgi:hypothetical protein